MKTRPLPDTDLARIAPLGRDEKRRQLERQKSGFSPITYYPTRAVALDILNAQSRLLGPMAETPLAVIEDQVRRLARGPDEFASNLQVTRLFWSKVREAGFKAYYVDEFNGFTTRAGETAAFWLKAVLVSPSGELLIPCPDYRRTHRLTSAGKKFAASVMHQAIRLQNPTDFGMAKLAVFQFPQIYNSKDRDVRFEVISDDSLFSAKDLASMIAETFELWDEVLMERTEEIRRGAGKR